jgi:hypothetical protein
MPTYRYPVLVWEDGEGYFNACPVETDEPVGLGRTTSEALRQVEEGLAWSFEEGWRATPDWDPARRRSPCASRSCAGDSGAGCSRAACRRSGCGSSTASRTAWTS